MKATFTKLFTLVVLLTGACHHASAQSAKFGRVSEEEIKMSMYDKDTAAAAVILSDYGSTRFEYIGELKVVFERHLRIKIFKKSAYDWADVVVPYYQKGTGRENVTNVKGFTYNLEGGQGAERQAQQQCYF